MRSIELCCACDEPTGRAGIGEDSLYTEDGRGPFCEECFDLEDDDPDEDAHNAWESHAFGDR